MIAITKDSSLDTGGTQSSTTWTDPVNATPIRTAVNNPLLTDDPSVAYGTLPPTGTSSITPNPVDVVPTTTTTITATEPAVTSTVIVPSTTDAIIAPTGTSVIAPNPVDVVATPVTTTPSATASTTTQPTGTVTISGVPLLGTSPSGILASLGGFFNGGTSDQSIESSQKENPTYWLYVIGGALILGYILTSKKNKSPK